MIFPNGLPTQSSFFHILPRCSAYFSLSICYSLTLVYWFVHHPLPNKNRTFRVWGHAPFTMWAPLPGLGLTLPVMLTSTWVKNACGCAIRALSLSGSETLAMGSEARPFSIPGLPPWPRQNSPWDTRSAVLGWLQFSVSYFDNSYRASSPSYFPLPHFLANFPNLPFQVPPNPMDTTLETAHIYWWIWANISLPFFPSREHCRCLNLFTA